jgi:hypothetical protein
MASSRLCSVPPRRSRPQQSQMTAIVASAAVKLAPQDQGAAIVDRSPEGSSPRASPFQPAAEHRPDRG